MKNKIKKITIELKCSECGKKFTGEAKIIKRNYVCGCDYPCNCDNGEHKFLVCICTFCKEENDIFAIKE